MKKKICYLYTIIAFLALITLSSCVEEKPSYYSETEERIGSFSCPFCNGYGCYMCSNGIVYSIVEIEKTYEKKGTNVSFRGSKTTFYAECPHCRCQLYIPISKGDSYCATCAAYNHIHSLKSEHVKRYR